MTTIDPDPSPSRPQSRAPAADPAPPPTRKRHIVLLVVGVLLAGFGLALSGLIAPLGTTMLQQGREGYLTSPTERYTVDGHAITSESLEVVIDDGLGTARSGPVARLLLRGTAATPGQEIFLGVGPRADVQAYLADVAHAELVGVEFSPFDPRYRTVPGGRDPAPPADQTFWTVSARGAGTQQIDMDVQNGSWAVVIMNADGSGPVSVDLQAGLSSPLFVPATVGAVVVGLLSLLLGAGLMIVGASGLGRSAMIPFAARHPGISVAHTPDRGISRYAVGLSGERDPVLSRGLWLVKWLLAIPHYVVLAFLWLAFGVSVVCAAVAVVVTGRYPRGLFGFNVGVLRWSWRVAFYATALGTDRYPPFTLAATDHPARLDVAYPEHPSRGLAVIQSWLLAIPHLVIIGLLAGAPRSWGSDPTGWSSTVGDGPAGFSLLGILGLVAGVTVLLTRRYPDPLFDLIVGLNRWVYRVWGYVAVMTDRYPPFRLDQGAREPLDPAPAPTTPAPVDLMR